MSSHGEDVWREIQVLQQEVSLLNTRNRKVGLDKAWDQSLARTLFVAVMTFLCLGVYMSAIRVKNSWLSAIVPTVGFVLTTWSFPTAKNAWVRWHGTPVELNTAAQEAGEKASSVVPIVVLRAVMSLGILY